LQERMEDLFLVFRRRWGFNAQGACPAKKDLKGREMEWNLGKPWKLRKKRTRTAVSHQEFRKRGVIKKEKGLGAHGKSRSRYTKKVGGRWGASGTHENASGVGRNQERAEHTVQFRLWGVFERRKNQNGPIGEACAGKSLKEKSKKGGVKGGLGDVRPRGSNALKPRISKDLCPAVGGGGGWENRRR